MIEGASGSTTLLREPIRLQNVSIVLEPMGRVVSTVVESIPLRFLCLPPSNSVAREGKWPHFQELQACRDFAGWSGVDF